MRTHSQRIPRVTPFSLVTPPSLLLQINLMKCSRINFRNASLSAAVIALTGVLSSCSDDEGITQYTVPKEVRAETTGGTPPSAPQVPQGQQLAWFFKLTGPSEQLAEHFPAFVILLKSVRFENRALAYDVPAGWSVENGSGMRYQTIKIEGTDPPLEVSVTSLPALAGDSLDYLKANIDRWRGQLELPPMDGENWEDDAAAAGELIRIPNPNLSMTIVNLTGVSKDFGETQMLAAVITETPSMAASTPPPSANPTPTSGPLKFKVPQGWEQNAGNSMRLASFAVAGENKEDIVDISVMRLGGGGSILENINRWRGQVKLEPITEEELKTTTEDVKISGKDANLALMKGETTAIMAATIPDGDGKWFFKMQGPTEKVAAEAERFREFLDSVSLEE